MQQELIGQQTLSVSAYLDMLNGGLKSFSARISGEVGKVDVGPTGHVYFSLRDEKDQSVMACILWKFRYQIMGQALQEGDKIVAYGAPSVYKLTGRFSFVAETVEPAGEGQLKKEYERLKQKLAAEGVFSPEEKRPLPLYPHKIGIITSRQGAVLGDFMVNLGKHGFKVKMIDARVEGQQATLELLSAIKQFKRHDIEVLVVMRGGGSFESLQPFNNEYLVREIAGFPVPVIAAIGHDRDVPLAALAADLAVSTPSIAATTLGDSFKKALLFLERQERQIMVGYERELHRSGLVVERSVEMVRNFHRALEMMQRAGEQRLAQMMAHFAAGNQYLIQAMTARWQWYRDAFLRMVESSQLHFAQTEKMMQVLDPQRQLERGYSIATAGGKVVTSAAQVKTGDKMDVRVSDGIIDTIVK